jgi:hypothetical protein
MAVEGAKVYVKQDEGWLSIAKVKSITPPSKEGLYIPTISTKDMEEAMRKQIERIENEKLSTGKTI